MTEAHEGADYRGFDAEQGPEEIYGGTVARRFFSGISGPLRPEYTKENVVSSPNSRSSEKFYYLDDHSIGRVVAPAREEEIAIHFLDEHVAQLVEEPALLMGLVRLRTQEGKLIKIEQTFPYQHPDAEIQYGIAFGAVSGSDFIPKSDPRSGDEISKAFCAWTYPLGLYRQEELTFLGGLPHIFWGFREFAMLFL